METVDGADALILTKELEVSFNFRECDGVEEFAEVRLTEQVGEQRLIDGESGGAPLGQGRIAIVDEVARVSKEERRREGRRLGRIDDVDLDFALVDGAEDVEESGHVEGIAKAFAVRFEDHREVGVS